MIQFNLLPDVKVDYLKTSRTKRLVVLASLTVTGLALFIFILLFLIVNVFQKQHLNNLNDDIKTSIQNLENVQDLDKVLTVQNQLSQLTGLHDEKPVSSRLNDYLVRLTPTDAKISEVSIDFKASTITIAGSGSNLETINKFADILKFTDYKEGDTQEKAFSDVVLSSFGVVNDNKKGGRATYSLEAKYNPAIFDGTKSVELIVPNIISTRSVTEKPSDLFEAAQSTNGQ